MNIPFELPVKAGEAAALTDMILQMAEGRKLTDELRQRIASRAGTLNLTSMTVHYGSLQADPTHQSAYFIAVDGHATGKTQPILLRVGLSSAPTSALYPNAFLVGRMRPHSGSEIVVNATPFSSMD